MTFSLIFSLALALEAAPVTGSAATSNSDDTSITEQAQRDYDEGVELFRAAQFEAAARAFERAYALVPESSLLYNISFAWEQAGELERALQYLERYATESAPEDAEKVAPQIEGLRQRLAKSQREPDSPEDGPATQATSADSPSPGPAGEGAASSPVQGEGPRRRVFTPLSATLLGVGLAGIGTGIGLAVAAWDQGRQVREGCIDTGSDRHICPDSLSGAAGRSRGMAIGADVAFAVGGAALASATILLAVRGTRLRREALQTSFAPVVRPSARSVGFSVTHRF